MTFLPGVVGILIHQSGCILQILDDIVVDGGYRLTRLTILGCILLRLDRTIAIGSNHEEITEGFHETEFTDGIILHSISDIRHRLDMTLGIIGTGNETVTAFPQGIGHIALALEVAGAEGSKEPVGTTDIIGIELQYSGEIAPAEHIVDEF